MEVGEQQLAAMDASAIDGQVLSLTTAGVQNLAADDAVRLQRQVTGLLAQVMRAYPNRLQTSATLATPILPPRPTS